MGLLIFSMLFTLACVKIPVVLPHIRKYQFRQYLLAIIFLYFKENHACPINLVNRVQTISPNSLQESGKGGASLL
jgi:hypothetical protein